MDDNKSDIPTLTDVACPGEILRARGLWLPERPTAPEAHNAIDSDWRDRLPASLEDRADQMMDETRRRAEAALDEALASADARNIDLRF